MDIQVYQYYNKVELGIRGLILVGKIFQLSGQGTFKRYTKLIYYARTKQLTKDKPFDPWKARTCPMSMLM